MKAAQKKVEGYNFDARKNVVQYDDVMNRHRKAIYAMRREILMQPDISKRINVYIDQEVSEVANSPALLTNEYESTILEVFPFEATTLDKILETDPAKFETVLKEEVTKLYKGREELFTPEVMRKVEREVYLQILDNLWMQHLENMDHLREGIHWMSVGQRDPLVEYRRQGQMLFDTLQNSMRHDIIRSLFHAEPIADQGILAEPFESDLTRAARQSVDNASRIIEGDEFEETDFKSKKTEQKSKKQAKTSLQKHRKVERQRRAKGKKRK